MSERIFQKAIPFTKENNVPLKYSQKYVVNCHIDYANILLNYIKVDLKERHNILIRIQDSHFSNL